MRTFFITTGYSILATFILAASSCNKNNIPQPTPPAAVQSDIAVWLTRADGSQLLQEQSAPLSFTDSVNHYPTIKVDPSATYQTLEGFGYTLTGGSAMLIQGMDSGPRNLLLEELFRCNNSNAAHKMCVSYLRLSLGASDLDEAVFSYNDIPADQEDLSLQHFSLAKDTLYLIPLLKSILAINPDLKLMASPWSPPAWMKSNKNSVGGSLLRQYYAVYAQYFVRYVQAMQSRGIRIHAVTVQNEPQHGGNNPSLLMSAAEQTEFVRDHLGPAFRAAGLDTKIIIWDHNCDNPQYPISILNDAAARSFIEGSAFHLYNGDISALSAVHDAHPAKKLYFTEQWTGANGAFDGDFLWHIKNVIIGSLNNWAVTALEWNLANDPGYGPHTPGGCTLCKGALTIDGNTLVRNVSYYIVAQASVFMPPGSVRIQSAGPAALHQTAFRRPDGKIALLVLNEGNAAQPFNIEYNGKKALAHLPPASAATFVWE
jgi:glucosylceramidase